jgi:WXG100 family type VII secretion target
MADGKLRVEYNTLKQISSQFADEAYQVREFTTHLRQLIDQMYGAGWRGAAADRWFNDMENVVGPKTQKLADILLDTSHLCDSLMGVFHEAEQAVAALFKNGSKAGAAPKSMGGFMKADDEFGSIFGDWGEGVAADITKFQNGVDGWSLISMDGSKGFKPGDLVSQKGPTCALYGPLNLLIASGYRDKFSLSQDGANTYAKIKEMKEAWWRPDMWFDNESDWGFGMDVSKSVVADYTSNYKSGDFMEWKTSGNGMWNTTYSPNRDKAEKFLVDTVKSGKPVLVGYEDDAFGSTESHVATVVGVQTYADGSVKSVIVATNWSAHPFEQIPGNTFMKNWLDDSGGSYVTVDRAPVKPPPDPNGFSAQLAREMEQLEKESKH